ncbi:hypothetical protein Gbem_1908 [Citrifermentans bemidjiense Bem]|uniref:Uncharacterized protein n=1 Tax=Citrifermentans bemidjiense (strain ATCC BAA-1014 / DSM 16622 / JCM 12645 / Bem) TaxID=404380 RepID=B5EB61_CITBB|nr:hypothetical protein [Citrifermentans bemidjiense]ACH38922.1 hypothetical protein Gbem_1908 [Citrifermentans bemidjiense Bem]
MRLDREVLKILSVRLGDLIQSSRSEIEVEAAQIYNDFARRNIVSPMALRMVAEMCCKHIKNRGQKICDLFSDLAERGVLSFIPETRDEFFGIARDHMKSDLQRLKTVTDRPMIGKFDPTSMLEVAISDGLDQIDAQIGILTLTKKVPSNSTSQTLTLYNYGTIGAIQSGSNMTAQISQNGVGSKEDLLKALENLKSVLTGEDIANKLDIIDTIDEGIKELDQESVNVFKLQGYIMMLVAALQTLPTLKPAVVVLAQAYDFYFGTTVSDVLVQ